MTASAGAGDGVDLRADVATVLRGREQGDDLIFLDRLDGLRDEREEALAADADVLVVVVRAVPGEVVGARGEARCGELARWADPRAGPGPPAAADGLRRQSNVGQVEGQLVEGAGQGRPAEREALHFLVRESAAAARVPVVDARAHVRFGGCVLRRGGGRGGGRRLRVGGWSRGGRGLRGRGGRGGGRGGGGGGGGGVAVVGAGDGEGCGVVAVGLGEGCVVMGEGVGVAVAGSRTMGTGTTSPVRMPMRRWTVSPGS